MLTRTNWTNSIDDFYLTNANWIHRHYSIVHRIYCTSMGCSHYGNLYARNIKFDREIQCHRINIEAYVCLDVHSIRPLAKVRFLMCPLMWLHHSMLLPPQPMDCVMLWFHCMTLSIEPKQKKNSIYYLRKLWIVRKLKRKLKRIFTRCRCCWFGSNSYRWIGQQMLADRIHCVCNGWCTASNFTKRYRRWSILSWSGARCGWTICIATVRSIVNAFAIISIGIATISWSTTACSRRYSSF